MGTFRSHIACCYCLPCSLCFTLSGGTSLLFPPSAYFALLENITVKMHSTVQKYCTAPVVCLLGATHEIAPFLGTKSSSEPHNQAFAPTHVQAFLIIVQTRECKCISTAIMSQYDIVISHKTLYWYYQRCQLHTTKTIFNIKRKSSSSSSRIKV